MSVFVPHCRHVQPKNNFSATSRLSRHPNYVIHCPPPTQRGEIVHERGQRSRLRALLFHSFSFSGSTQGGSFSRATVTGSANEITRKPYSLDGHGVARQRK